MENKYSLSSYKLLDELKHLPAEVVFYPIKQLSTHAVRITIGAKLIRENETIQIGNLGLSMSSFNDEWLFLTFLDEVSSIVESSMMLASTEDLTDINITTDIRNVSKLFSKCWYAFFKVYRPMANQEEFLAEWNLYIFHNKSEYIF